MCPTQLRNIPVDFMASERMLLPKWAKVAATVLSDKQIAASQAIPSEPSALASLPSIGALPRQNSVDGDETVDGTVSRKGKFGFTCESCGWVPKKGGDPDWVTTKEFVGDVKSKMFAAHWPERCKKCKSRMKRWTCAARKYDQLEILRTLEGRHCLRFLTLTKESWNVKVPVGQVITNGEEVASPLSTPPTLWGEAEKLKKTAVRQFRNWRTRNKYWISREAKGQAYYECTMKPVWNGWGWDEVQLHFHIHTVVCSKRIENKDIQIDLDTLNEIPMSTTIQREWGGIVDVRACKTWKHKDGAVKTSKRFVMNYLVDYINKSPHWQSVPFGDWSN
ncbi:MAG: hypothetical protein [Circular genetic element sp.]|nr:MAG: hypothetical protein [Circular genetic element sp.]